MPNSNMNGTPTSSFTPADVQRIIVPGSSRTVITGLHDEALKIKISAAPEKGRANQSLIEFLAKKFGVKKNAVSIVSGQSKALKKVQVLGIEAETLLDALNSNESRS